MQIYYPAGGSNPGPAEPEADALPSEPARRARIIVNLCVYDGR